MKDHTWLGVSGRDPVPVEVPGPRALSQLSV
jgi:hypothetical protein